jgi:Domain of unknown function (DUF2027)/Smr domain
MKLKIGDLVRFLNEKGEGTVSKIINKTTVAVTISDGFEIPYLIAELVLVFDGTKTEEKIEPSHMQMKHEEVKQKIKYTKQQKKGIYVAFAPEKINDIPNSDINVWLINYSDLKIIFTYSILQNSNFKTIETGSAEAYEPLLIETIDRKILHDFSNFKIDILFYDVKEHAHQMPVSELIKLKPIKLYKDNAFCENSFIPEKSLIMSVYCLDDVYETNQSSPKVDLAKILFQKQAQNNISKKSKPHISNDPNSEMEIDLHIEELIDNFSGMSNFEIVQIQLNNFKNALDNAINGHYRKLVVIHGVGNGRLKQEVRNVLASYKNVRFYDGSYAKYGFGATEILIS